MNNLQLQKRIQELQRQLTAMRQMFLTVENLADEAFAAHDDEWPPAVDDDLHLLEQTFHRFCKTLQQEEFLDLLIAGRPGIAESVNAADAAASKAATGFRVALDSLGHDDSPNSSFTSWHWFEHAFHEFLKTQSRCLSAAMQMLLDETEGESRPQHPAPPLRG